MSCASAVLPRKNQAVEWIELTAGNTPWLGLGGLGWVLFGSTWALCCCVWPGGTWRAQSARPTMLRTAGIVTRYGGYRYPWMPDMITRMPDIVTSVGRAFMPDMQYPQPTPKPHPYGRHRYPRRSGIDARHAIPIAQPHALYVYVTIFQLQKKRMPIRHPFL